MKRAAVDHSVLTGLGAAFCLLLAAAPAFAQEEEEQEGTREQVEAEDNVTICVTDGVAKDGEKDLIVFDKDNPEEEWEVNARVKFRPKPEKEYILRDKKFNWTASEGFTVSKADDARPTIKATAEAAGTEGKLKLHLSWEEEKLDEDDNPTGEIKIHPWSNDKASMRLLVPEFELQSVSYNLGDNGATGALPFYDNSNTPKLIQAPEYVKNDTRSTDNVGVLYKKGVTPKMRARFTIKPSTAGEIVLFANQQGQSLIPTAQSDENAKLSGTTKETNVTCVSPLPNVIRSGVAEHVWKWSVYGRQLEPKDSQNQNGNRDSGFVTATVNNVFIVLNNPNKKTQDPWINCMKYGIEKLNAEGATSNQQVLRRIVPNFRSTTCYPPKNEYGSHQLAYGVMDSYLYQAYPNISHLYNSELL